MPRELLLCRDIRVPLTAEDKAYHDALALEKAKKLYRASLKSKGGDARFAIYKKSLDARRKDQMRFIYTVSIEPENGLAGEKLPAGFERMTAEPFCVPCVEKATERPVVVGFGPAGMFLAYTLTLAGLRPIVLERGADVEERTRKVKKYFRTGELDETTNVQFGEGGAGTFSDGKLLTRIHDPLCAFVLETFVRFGAPDEIQYLAKPHVGTDRLKEIVRRMREEIRARGAEIRFCSCVTDILRTRSGDVSGVVVNHSEKISCTALFLCIGHSARDTFRTLMAQDICLTAKPYSVGVRVEHWQEDIDRALYGKFAGYAALEKGQYTLSLKENAAARAVYSFCMCPGGKVVASASQKGTIVTNGMSDYARDGRNANAAIAVAIRPEDYGNTPEKAMAFQEEIERKAFLLAGAGGAAPVETLGDFKRGCAHTEPGRILPSYTGKTAVCDLDMLFPSYVNERLLDGFAAFDKQISGFASDDAVLTAPETRTSSPVRIDRDAFYRSVSCASVYPCGEGAGYAGGITSAAVDGIRTALAYIETLR